MLECVMTMTRNHLHYIFNFSANIRSTLIESRALEIQIVCIPNSIERFPPIPAPIAKNNIMPKIISGFSKRSLIAGTHKY